MLEAATKQATWPVSEVFGPVVQGEGAMLGVPTYFVRVAGCSYRCEWCDTMYAVDPAQWSKTALRMSADEIVEQVGMLANGPDWVTISGGGPAMYDLMPLVDAIQRDGLLVAVETQGDRWRDWLARVDHLCVSPKPPSSGMATLKHADEFERFMDACVRRYREPVPGVHHTCLKVVVFDEDDYQWALDHIHYAEERGWPMYLSVGTSAPMEGYTRSWYRANVCERMAWLMSRVAEDPRAKGVHVTPQLHVLAYGEQRGV
jgi:7-carboxy-7-deazaguanine synthase